MGLFARHKTSLTGVKTTKMAEVSSTAVAKFLRKPQLILRMIELSEMTTILTLMSIPDFHSLIQRFRKSILKDKHKDFRLPAGHGGSPALLVYRLSSPGPGLHTNRCCPALVPVNDWASLEVMQARESEIESLINSPYLRLRPGPGCSDFPWPSLGTSAKAKLGSILKRALYQCDVLRDMEGKAVVELGVPANRWHFSPATAPPEWPACSDAFSAVTANSSRFQELITRELVPVMTRRLQVAYIEKLPDGDLVGLSMLCRIVAKSWHEVRMFPAHMFGDSESILFEREVAFKEAMLRHGSWFLYAEVRGFGHRAKHFHQLFDEVHQEVREGGPMERIRFEPALLATMNDELSKRFKTRVKLLESMVIIPIVVKMIGTDEHAFTNPASRRGHGASALTAAPSATDDGVTENENEG